jgi:hypothetical protein
MADFLRRWIVKTNDRGGRSPLAAKPANGAFYDSRRFNKPTASERGEFPEPDHEIPDA